MQATHRDMWEVRATQEQLPENHLPNDAVYPKGTSFGARKLTSILHSFVCCVTPRRRRWLGP